MTPEEESRDTERKLAQNKQFQEVTGGNCTGLSILDWFAGQAQGIEVAMPHAVAVNGCLCPTEDAMEAMAWWAQANARVRYIDAAAMLAEKKRREAMP